jgi:hypothetical protein
VALNRRAVYYRRLLWQSLVRRTTAPLPTPLLPKRVLIRCRDCNSRRYVSPRTKKRFEFICDICGSWMHRAASRNGCPACAVDSDYHDGSPFEQKPDPSRARASSWCLRPNLAAPSRTSRRRHFPKIRAKHPPNRVGPILVRSSCKRTASRPRKRHTKPKRSSHRILSHAPA